MSYHVTQTMKRHTYELVTGKCLAFSLEMLSLNSIQSFTFTGGEVRFSFSFFFQKGANYIRDVGRWRRG